MNGWLTPVEILEMAKEENLKRRWKRLSNGPFARQRFQGNLGLESCAMIPPHLPHPPILLVGHGRLTYTLKWWNENIRHFDPEEFTTWPGISPNERIRTTLDYMNPLLGLKLDALREYVGKPIIIHEGYAESGHSENSAHYFGNAVDLHIEGLNLIEQYLVAERFLWGGLGLYPEWNTPGLHLDIREAGAYLSYKRAKRWMCLGGEEVALDYSGILHVMQKVY